MTTSKTMGGEAGHALGNFPCGHDRNGPNTKWVRNGAYPACRACFNAHDRVYRRAKRAAERSPAPPLSNKDMNHEG